MSQNVTKFTWNKQKAQAAFLLAEDKLTDEAIAEKVGIARRQLIRWKEHPEFATRVQKHLDDITAAIVNRGVARRVNRVRALDERWERMQKVIDDRASSPEMEGVPGGDTGLLVHQLKAVGKGEQFQLVHEYAVDTGLLKELREHEKQAAQELGQWADRHEHTGKDGGPIGYANLSDEELNRRIAEVETRILGIDSGEGAATSERSSPE